MYDDLTLGELRTMSDRAWREAARCWGEWRAFAQSAGLNDRETCQMLHDSAWAAENYWRSLYDAIKQRGATPSVPTLRSSTFGPAL